MANKISVVIDVAVDRANTAIGSFRKSVAEAETATGKFKAGAASVGDSLKANIMPVAAAAGTAMVAFAAKSVQAASNLSESTNAVNVSFGRAADGVLELGENAAESMGLSKSAFNEAAVGFAAFAENIAGPGGDAADIIGELTGRAADFGSVMNTDVATATDIFRSALSGETEPIKKFGIDMSAAAVEAHALATGLVESKSEMTEAVKVQARYSLLMEKTSKFQGDFANTSDGLANSSRIAAARFEDLQATIGTKLLPVVADATGLLLGLADAIDAVGSNSIVKFGNDLGVFNNAFGVTKDLWDKGPGQMLKWATGFESTAESVSSLSGSLVQESIDAAFVERKTLDVAAANEAHAQAVTEARQAILDKVDALKAERQAQEDALDSLLEANNSNLAYRNQIADTAAAIYDASLVQLDSAKSDAEKAQASRDAEGAALAQADAAVRLAEDVALADGKTLSAQQAAAIYRDELTSLAGYMDGESRAAILALVENLGSAEDDAHSGGDAIGRQLASGMAAGIVANAYMVPAATKKMVEDGLAEAIRTGKIQSPSRLFAEEVGQPIAAGIAEGIVEDGDKINDALTNAIKSAEKDAIEAAEDLVDTARDAFDGRWAEIDSGRNLEDLNEGVADAEEALKEALKSGDADKIAAARDRLKDANYRLLKATTDAIQGTKAERDAWIETAKAAGLTKAQIDGLIKSYQALKLAGETATTSKAAISAEAARATKIREDFAWAVRNGLVGKDELAAIGSYAGDPSFQLSEMARRLNMIQAFMGWDVQKYHKGGVVPGAPGTEVPAILQAGETVIPAGKSMGMAPTVVNVTVNGADPNMVVAAIRKYVRTNGPISGIT